MHSKFWAERLRPCYVNSDFRSFVLESGDRATCNEERHLLLYVVEVPGFGKSVWTGCGGEATAEN